MVRVTVEVWCTTRLRTTANYGYRYVKKLGWIMHVDAGASVAYLRIDRPDFVVAAVGNTLLAVVVLESCSHHEEQLGAFQQQSGALVVHHLVRQHHRRRQHHSHYRTVRVHSSMPSKGQFGNMDWGRHYILESGFCPQPW
jgi:hypothetical protein